MCGINFFQSSFEIKETNFLKALDNCQSLLEENKLNLILEIVRKLKRNQNQQKSRNLKRQTTYLNLPMKIKI